MSATAAIPFSLHSRISLSGNADRSLGDRNTRCLRTETGLDTEVILIERCLAGEQPAWEELIQVYSRRVYTICYRFTGTASDAQDLTQDVFLRVFKSLNTFRAGEGTFNVWLTRLTRNLLVDHYRRSRNERATDSLDEPVPPSIPAEAVGADGLLETRETREALQSALVKLSPELREAIILRDLQDMEYREIARVLDIPEGTVKSRLSRGRAELARILRRSSISTRSAP
jgi:RNA polymerase sigma-70 factor, ECF subfamily